MNKTTVSAFDELMQIDLKKIKEELRTSKVPIYVQESKHLKNVKDANLDKIAKKIVEDDMK